MNGHLLKLGEYRESRDIGVVWPVVEDHGKCWCGTCDMTVPVAFFVNREDAVEWINNRNDKS
jgi:hypothetical protein